MKLYVVCTHENRLINYCIEDLKDFSKLLPFDSWPGTMINPQWLELPISRTSLQGPRDVKSLKVTAHETLMYPRDVEQIPGSRYCSNTVLITYLEIIP